MLICLVLCAAAVLPTAFSDTPEAQNVQPHPGRNNEMARRLAANYIAARNQGLLQGKVSFARPARNGRDFDTLLGRSFGTSKRNTQSVVSKKNFDEIDNAGFKDYLSKRNFDEIDSDGFSDDFRSAKRNFDEIDNAGFQDYLYKRNFDEIDNAGFRDYLYKRNFDEIDNAGFRDYLLKRNFDEIDNAGFRDYLYKRTLQDFYLPEVRNERVVCTAEGCWSRKLLLAHPPKYLRDL